MKQLVRTAVAALAAFLATPAWSQDTRPYLGASIGQSEFKDACEGLTIPCDDKDTAWKIFAGVQFNRHLAVELGYTDLGETSASGVIAGISVSAKAEVTAFELLAVGSIPVMERFSLYGKLGFYRAELDISGSQTFGPITVPINRSDSNTDLTFAFGVRYDFTRNLGIRAEWQRYLDVGNADVGEDDIDLLSVGLIWRF